MKCNCPPAVLQYAVAICVLYLLLRDIRPMRLWMQVTGRNSVREHFMPKVSNKNLKGIVAVDENNNMVQLTKADFESVINTKFNEVRSTIESTRTALERKISTAQTTANKGVADAKAAKDEANKKQPKGNYIADGQFVALARDGDKGCHGRGCRAIVGFKQKGRSVGDEEGGWRELDGQFGHGRSSRMKIWKATQ